MDIERIVTGDAPTPAGHYSQAVAHDGLLFVAYIVAIAHWPAFNAVYAELLGDARPANPSSGGRRECSLRCSCCSRQPQNGQSQRRTAVL